MNPLYGLMLFGVAFFGFMVVVAIVKARRKKEMKNMTKLKGVINRE